MIAKRTLMKWRREALSHQEQQESLLVNVLGIEESRNYVKRVLELTQELIDQQLLKELKK